MDILQTSELTRRFGQKTAVDALTVAIGKGEIFGLLGPNGAGKTTTIKMLTTLLPPTSGNARVAGFNIVDQAPEVRRVIGYVPQLVSADGNLNGYENLLIFAKLYDIPRAEREARIRNALEFMGLADAAQKMVREYSGGMIRRLEIAQSMLHRPPVLFLDEPTVGLDPVARRAVWEHIEELRDRLRHHGPPHHPPHGGGRQPLQPGGRHASRPGGGHRHPRGPQRFPGGRRQDPGRRLRPLCRRHPGLRRRLPGGLQRQAHRPAPGLIWEGHLC